MDEHRPCPCPPAPDDRALDLEFAFTPWSQSCRDPFPTLQECRRRTGHEGQHAAGFGAGRTRWEAQRPDAAPLRDGGSGAAAHRA